MRNAERDRKNKSNSHEKTWELNVSFIFRVIMGMKVRIVTVENYVSIDLNFCFLSLSQLEEHALSNFEDDWSDIYNIRPLSNQNWQ